LNIFTKNERKSKKRREGKEIQMNFSKKQTYKFFLKILL